MPSTHVPSTHVQTAPLPPPSQAIRRFDRWVWRLIYAGMLGFGLGVAIDRGGARFGRVLAVLGAASVGLGVVLVVLRSRMGP